MKGELPSAALKDRALFFLGRRRVFLAEGDSMLPTIENGQKVLIAPMSRIDVGDIILAEHPYKSSVKIIKRIAEIESDGKLQLIGDNPAQSTDSRTFGAVSIESIVGRVVCRLK